MTYRLATLDDLTELKKMYTAITKDLENHQINIWDDYYPNDFLGSDIDKNELYVLIDQGIIISAFALNDDGHDTDLIKWEAPKAKALYMYRFGVNINQKRRGIGKLMLDYAMKTAKSKDAKYLRLFAVDYNKPAINLYKQVGFTCMEGIFIEDIDGVIYEENGYEIKL